MTDCHFAFHAEEFTNDIGFNRSICSELEDHWKGRLKRIVIHKFVYEEERVKKWIEMLRREYAVPEGLEVDFWEEIGETS